MKWMLFIIPAFLLVGCSSQPKPYLEIGLGYQIDNNTDWYLRTDKSWTCDNGDTFHIEGGVEFEDNWKVGYHHQSHVSCGGPFNSHPELYQDEIIVTKKWGGRK